MIDDAHDHDAIPALRSSRPRALFPVLLLDVMLWSLVAVACFGCSDAAGPSTDLHPQFKKVYNSGDASGGGGGGANGGAMVCEYPKHWSPACAEARAKAQTVGVTSLHTCITSGFNVGVCVVGGATTGFAWGAYDDMPGSDGIAHDPTPPYRHVVDPCQFQCWVHNNMPPEAGGNNLGYNYPTPQPSPWEQGGPSW